MKHEILKALHDNHVIPDIIDPSDDVSEANNLKGCKIKGKGKAISGLEK